MKKLLRCWWSRNNVNQIYKKVDSITEAIRWLKEQAEKDLKDKRVTWNAGGLLEFDETMVSDDEDGWCEYYNAQGLDIMEVAGL